MTLGRPLWLLGLAALVPLVLVHLRRRAARPTPVADLARWRDLAPPAAAASRRLRRPARPWLLLLQALVVTAAVVASAEPERPPARPPALDVVVLDDSFWLAAPGRSALAASLASRWASGRVALVVAGATPHVAYRGRARGLAAAIASVRPGRAAADLRAGLLAAAPLLAGSESRILLLHAPEDAPPAATGVSTVALGHPATDVGLFDPSARCGIGAAAACEIAVSVRNGGPARRVALVATTAPGAASRFAVAAPARGSTRVLLQAQPRSHVVLRLAAPDALPADDRVTVAVPGAAGVPTVARVTVVGGPGQSAALARAFGAVPGVRLRLRTPDDVTRADVTSSDLLVLDGAATAPGVASARAVLLVHPPSLAGRSGAAARGAVSVTSAAAAPLLDDVHLDPLVLRAGAARRYGLPPWLEPLARAGAVPLLAAGDDGVRAVALLAFEPAGSNLPQLDALPVLARNLVRWATAVPAPGARQEPVRVDLTAWTAHRPVTGGRRSLVPWLLGLALVALVLELVATTWRRA